MILGGGGHATAGEPTAAGALEGLQRWIDGTRDLRADFEQVLVSGALGADVAETGRFQLLRPGRMRWDYVEPERKVALVDGERTRLYLAADRQLWEGRLEDAGTTLPTLLASERPLAELFDPSLLAGTAGGGGSLRLRLAPRGGEQAFDEAVLVLRPPEFAVEEVEVLDAAGNRMRYRFSRLERNRGVSAAAFAFEPPAGTEIMARP
jgi:outer membrane lipoprotein carrier protein